MKFPSLIDFLFKRCFFVVFNFIQILIEHSASNSEEPDQMPRTVASDLSLHCLSMPLKKHARLIWANTVGNIVTTCNTCGGTFCGKLNLWSFKDESILF